MRITRKLAGCDDGTCPAVWETDDPAVIGVQGAELADAQALASAGPVPPGERVVLIPRALLEGLTKGA